MMILVSKCVLFEMMNPMMQLFFYQFGADSWCNSTVRRCEIHHKMAIIICLIVLVDRLVFLPFRMR